MNPRTDDVKVQAGARPRTRGSRYRDADLMAVTAFVLGPDCRLSALAEATGGKNRAVERFVFPATCPGTGAAATGPGARGRGAASD
ncbi:hypothetical protein PV721_43065 [Streptomyces sp. MB09-01]|uniref:hypothetical protein n=1 Tax=Streptomyces sp. MB09-01 TaxID=3028666 RepID=UPI0029B42F60|nr:hypothetical protein [Streptomyces sp. MB09-01]MDX3540948.1 hypothetical protein [Streptomyces sp. MB09-01]